MREQTPDVERRKRSFRQALRATATARMDILNAKML
jgi:hypothetical protein